MIDIPFLCRADTSHEIKVKPFCHQSIFRCLCFLIRTKFFQYPAVFPQLVIHIPYHVIRIRIESVVIAIPAHIGAKFLINPSHQRLIAFQTVCHELFCSRFLFSGIKMIILNDLRNIAKFFARF